MGTIAVRAQNPAFGRATIQSAVANFGMQPPQLTIVGTGFGSTTPGVTLDGVLLNVLSFSQTMIVAQLPTNQPPGTFLLTIAAGAVTASFDVTIGTAGPAGASGPAGPTGPQGLPGPVNVYATGRPTATVFPAGVNITLAQLNLLGGNGNTAILYWVTAQTIIGSGDAAKTENVVCSLNPSGQGLSTLAPLTQTTIPLQEVISVPGSSTTLVALTCLFEGSAQFLAAYSFMTAVQATNVVIQ